MSLRRLLNVAHAFLSEPGRFEITVTRRGGRKEKLSVDDWLDEPLVVTETDERKRRAKANQAAQRALMGAFGSVGRR